MQLTSTYVVKTFLKSTAGTKIKTLETIREIINKFPEIINTILFICFCRLQIRLGQITILGILQLG